jgi:hypothetical protein
MQLAEFFRLAYEYYMLSSLHLCGFLFRERYYALLAAKLHIFFQIKADLDKITLFYIIYKCFLRSIDFFLYLCTRIMCPQAIRSPTILEKKRNYHNKTWQITLRNKMRKWKKAEASS